MAEEMKFLILFIFVWHLPIRAKYIQVKIVEEPAVYKGVNSYYQQHQITHVKELEPRVDPIEFSGPPHLSVLNGKCFSLIENSYKYELCPFHNVTQREQTVRWNAFSGILGVFQGWSIINKTFSSMLMSEGDYCPGNKPRQTKIFLKCGKENKLLSVNEPATCCYEMDFLTPLACPQDAMLVYPVLSGKGQAKWEEIEENLWRKEITSQGYNKQRKKLFIGEGLLASDSKGQDRVKELSDLSSKSGGKKKEKRNFRTLELCSKAYEELHDEVERLRKLISPFNKKEVNSTKNTRDAEQTTLSSTFNKRTFSDTNTTRLS